MNIKEKAKSIKTDIPAVYLSLKDKDTPKIAKILAAITVVYALSPVDLIPDFIPVLGYLDDAVILPMLIALTIKLIPKNVWEKNKIRSAEMWQDGKPQKWYFAVPFVIFWLFIIGIIVKVIVLKLNKV